MDLTVITQIEIDADTGRKDKRIAVADIFTGKSCGQRIFDPIFFKSGQDSVPVFQCGRHFQIILRQQIVADVQTKKSTKLLIAANHRERIVIAGIGFDHLVHIGICFQISFQVGAILVDDVA